MNVVQYSEMAHVMQRVPTSIPKLAYSKTRLEIYRIYFVKRGLNCEALIGAIRCPLRILHNIINHRLHVCSVHTDWSQAQESAPLPFLSSTSHITTGVGPGPGSSPDTCLAIDCNRNSHGAVTR